MAQSKEAKRKAAEERNKKYQSMPLGQKIEHATKNGHPNSKQVKKLVAMKKKEVK